MRTIATVVALSLPAFGLSQAFNWDDQTAGTYAGPYTMTEGGNSVTVNALGAANPLIVIANPGVALLGTLSGAAFDGTVAYGSNADQIWTFSKALSSVTFDYGDNGGDDDGNVTISAYDASDTLLGSQTKNYGTSGLGDSMTFNFNGMVSFTCESGGAAPGSLFWEVSSSTVAAPEPLSIAALGFGVLALVRRRK